MYDLQRIEITMSEIEKYFSQLKAFNLNKDNVYDKKIFYASSMVLFTILNKAIDLALLAVRGADLGVPRDYPSHFILLKNKGLISEKLCSEMIKLAKDRNVLSHEYGEIDEKKLLNIQKRVFFVKDFVARIVEVVKK